MINGEMLKNMTTEEQFGFLCEDGVRISSRSETARTEPRIHQQRKRRSL